MAEADYLKAVVLDGAEKSADTAQLIESTRLTGNKIGAGLNSLKANVNQAIREMLVEIARIRDTKSILVPHLAGSGVGYIANAMVFLERVDEELQEAIQKLNFMKNQIEDWQREIVPILDRDLGEQAGKLRTVAGELRSYSTTI